MQTWIEPGRPMLALLIALACGCAADETPASDGEGRTPGQNTGAAGSGGARPGSVVPVGAGCAAISQSAVNRLQGADIVFAIDNSGSMDEEILFVREQMNAFSQQIVDSGVDVRIILISAPLGQSEPSRDGDGDGDGDGDDEENGVCIDPPLGSGSCPDDSNLPRYLHVPEEVSSHDSLNLIVETYPEWRDQLRPNATKSFVVVTDDDATDGPNDSAEAFLRSIAALDPASFGKITFSGIFCFTECPEAAEIGRVYMDLVAQTGGVSGDLCLQNFAPVFDALARAVISASSIDCRWDIPPAPAGQTFEVGTVNVQYRPSGGGAAQPIYYVASESQCGARGGWFYDDLANPRQLLVCPSTCNTLQADPDAILDVLFGCKTSEGPD